VTGVNKSPATARHLGLQTLVAASGSIFTLAVGLPLQVYVSRVLGAGGLGVYGLLEGAVNTTSGFLNLGLAQTVVRFVPSHLEKGEYGYVRRLLGVSITTLLLVGVFAYGVWLVALPYLESIWPEIAGQAHHAALMGLLLPLGLLIHLFQQGLRGFQEIRYMVLGSSVVQLSVKAGVTVVAFALGMTLGGYILATVIATSVGALWMAYGLKRKINDLPADEAGPSSAPVAEWRRYAAISYTNALLGGTTAYIDRLLLGIFMGSGAVGVLIVLRQIQQLPQMFNQMLLVVGAPMFAAAHVRNDRTERGHLYVLMTDWVMKISLPFILFLFLFGRPVLLLFGPQFAQDGAGILWILVLGQAVNLACGPIGNIALMSGLEGEVLRLTTFNAVLQVILLVLLAPAFGLLGVAIVHAITAVFINAAVMVLLRSRLGLRWWHRRFAGWLLPSCAAVCVGAGIIYSGLNIGFVVLAVTLALMYATFSGVVLLQGVNEDEKDLLRHLRDRLFGRAAA
jgi:O-antigen/teichoic acid export membrane protein